MESSIWLLAYLYSLESFNPLQPFLRAAESLRQGVGLFSDDFLALHPQFRPLSVKHSRRQLQQILKDLCQSVERGHLLLYPGHSFYPQEYLLLEQVPYLLRLRGAPVWLALPGLSVVGHREPSASSLKWMEEHLAEFFRRQTCFSVSGGARGVDQKTHWLSLRTERPTVVLLPSGLNCIYPTSLQDWTCEILDGGGALLSEYEDDQKMEKHFFAQRNRLISGLGKATLIIEARRRSGTLLTAREALEQSRPLWILPGHPMDVHMQGSLDLLVSGATPVLDATDLSLLFSSEVQGLTGFSLETHRHLVQGLVETH